MRTKQLSGIETPLDQQAYYAMLASRRRRPSLSVVSAVLTLICAAGVMAHTFGVL